MNRRMLDKKVAVLRWFSSLEDEKTIMELEETMKREKQASLEALEKGKF